jgi:hypothetical protein
MTLDEIVKNKKELIALKMTTIKHSDTSTNIPFKDLSITNKEVNIKGYDGYTKVIANTYYWLDSHGDVHVKGCFTKTIKENKNKIFHLDNHDSSNGFRSKVGNVIDVLEVEVPWQSLGIDKAGNTICVLGVSELIEDYNRQVYDAYKNKEIDQHSVGMMYVNIDLAVNDPNYVEEYKVWNEVYPSIGNKQTANEQGYFWAIREAKLKEYSCVLWDGSNELTPTAKDIEPSADTQDKGNEAADTQSHEDSTSKPQIKSLSINKFL